MGIGKAYGKELVLDLHGCNVGMFNRKSITAFLKGLCELIDMKQEKLIWWDMQNIPKKDMARYENNPHLYGTSCVQFIETSNITMHCLDKLERVYMNIFSCKDFDADKAARFAADWFGGNIVNQYVFVRV